MYKIAFYFSLFILLNLHTVLPSSNLLGQTSTSEISKEDIQDMVQRNIVPIIEKTETTGSPYLYEAFLNGIVTLENERNTEPVLMNYNVYENRVDYSDGENIYAINGNNILEFTFTSNQTSSVFKKGFNSRRLNEDEFVEILVDGDTKLLLKHEVSFQENLATYGSATQKDEYLNNQRYYVNESGNTKDIRRLRERNVLRSIDSNRELMEEYVKSNNLDLSNLEDIIKFFQHYNQLSE